MSLNDESKIRKFLKKINSFIKQKNIIHESSPTKRRDIREVISLLKHSMDHLDEKKKGALPRYQSAENSFIHLDKALSEIKDFTEFETDKNFAFFVLLSYSKIYKLLGDSEKEKTTLIEILQLSQQLKNVQYQALVKLNLGRHSFDQHEFSNSLKHLTEASELFKSINDFKGESDSCFEIAKAFHRSGDYQSAKKYYEIALRIAEGIANKTQLAQIKNNLGVVFRIMGESEHSEYLFQCACETFKEIKDLGGQSDCLNNLAIVYLQRSNYQHALTYLNDGLKLSNEIEDFQQMAFLNLNKGLFYLEVGDPRNACKYCTEALVMLAKIDSSLGIAKSSKILGSIFRNYNQYKIASLFYEESIHFYEDFSIPLGVANTCAEYAKMLIEYEKIDKAVHYFHRAYEIYQSLKLFNHTDRLRIFLNTPENDWIDLLQNNDLIPETSQLKYT